MLKNTSLNETKCDKKNVKFNWLIARIRVVGLFSYFFNESMYHNGPSFRRNEFLCSIVRKIPTRCKQHCARSHRPFVFFESILTKYFFHWSSRDSCRSLYHNHNQLQRRTRKKRNEQSFLHLHSSLHANSICQDLQ